MARQGVFICGTDTDCGKTYFSLQLLKRFSELSMDTVALKPVSCGCEETTQGLRNADTLQLQQAASIDLPYSMVNPLAFLPPISPNVAAEFANMPLHVELIVQACEPGLTQSADMLVVEGCGGWHCPINKQETMADVAQALSLPVVLVVGLKLGCLNHSVLTWRALQQAQVPVVGWVANYLSDSMLAVEENIQTLVDFMGCPPLTVLPFQQDLSERAATDLLESLVEIS